MKKTSKIIETTKSVGYFIIGIAAMIGLVILVVILIKGGIALAGKIFPVLMKINGIVTLIFIFVLIPLAFFKKTRTYSGMGMFFSSYIFGFCLWVYSALVALFFWGWFALFIGLFLAGVGVLPIAFIASLLKGEWLILLNLILMAVFTYGGRIIGMRIIEKAERENQIEQYQSFEETREITEGETNFCSNCGKEISSSSVFCEHCGAKLRINQ